MFGGSLPAQIWNRFMSEAVKKLPVKDFVYPQFTGHTVTSPYSYIPVAPTTHDDGDADDAARPGTEAADAGTDAAASAHAGARRRRRRRRSARTAVGSAQICQSPSVMTGTRLPFSVRPVTSKSGPPIITSR